jgi:hypothetical protein
LIFSVVVAAEVVNGVFVCACSRQPTETAISKIEAKTTKGFSIIYHSPISGDKDYEGLGKQHALCRWTKSLDVSERLNPWATEQC